MLTVTDPSLETSVDQVVITVGNTAPTATITMPLQGAPYRILDNIMFAGSGTDPEEGTLPASAFEWTVNLKHAGHLHFDFFNISGIKMGAFVAADHGDDSNVEICLTVTDSAGLEDTHCVDIFPDTVMYTIDSVPQGVTIDYSGETGVTPFVVETQINATRTVTAALHFGALTFSSWSDAGAIGHEITVGETPLMLTATYAPLIWDGGGATTSWSEAENWSADLAPGSGGTATFDATSSKDAVVDPDFGGEIDTVILADGYGGEISMQRPLDITGDLAVDGGSFLVADGPTVVQTESFSDFSDVSGLQLNGDAAQVGSVLRLTPELDDQAGSAFHTTPIPIDGGTSFSTSFSFRLHGSGPGADGLAWMIQSAGPGALGSIGGGGGFGGIAPSLGVQIDTYANASDPNDNHIAVITDGSTEHVDLFTPGFDLNDGVTHYMWIDYDAATDTLDVYLSESSPVKPAIAVMSTPGIDLVGLLLSQAYMGFGAATGGLEDNQDVESWDFSITNSIGLTVAGQVTHTGGTLRQTREVTNESRPMLEITDGAAAIKYRGLDLTTSADLGNVTANVTAIDQGQGESCPNGGALGADYADRCFDVTVSNEEDTTVRLWAHTNELNGIGAGDLELARWTGSAWEIPTANASNGTDGGSWAYAEADTDEFGEFLLAEEQTPPTCAGLEQEGEAGLLFGDMLLGNDAAASGGQYVAMDAGSPPLYGGLDPLHRASYCVTVTTAGTYHLIANIHALDNLTDSFFVTVDGQPAGGYLWDTHHNTQYGTDFLADRGGPDPVEITLTAGEHTIDFYAREPDTRLDKFQLQAVGP